MASKTKTPKYYGTHVTLSTGERIYVKGRTKAERDAKVEKAKAEDRRGLVIGDNTTFAEFAATWVHAYKEPKLRASSLSVLKVNLEKRILPYFGAMRLRDIKPLHVQMFVASMSGLSKSVQTKCLSTVKAILFAAASNGLITVVPVERGDRAGGEEPEEKEPLTREQAGQLLDAVYGTRAYGFCLIALTTGMRRGEILGLMWEDIDWTSGCINVRHNKSFLVGSNDVEVSSTLKTKAAQRRLPITPVLRGWLEREFETSRSPYVLSMSNGNSLTKSSANAMWSIVKRRLEREGLDFHCHPHLLRHTFATQLFEAGMDIKQVQYLMGHSSPEMTLKIYTHYSRKSREEETADKLRDALSFLAG